MEVQKALGADIVMIFDECTPFPATEEQARASMELSLRWAARSRAAHEGNPAALFGIVQGGMHDSLRHASLEGLKPLALMGMPSEGFPWGTREEMHRILESLEPRMPVDAPRYLMG